MSSGADHLGIDAFKDGRLEHSSMTGPLSRRHFVLSAAGLGIVSIAVLRRPSLRVVPPPTLKDGDARLHARPAIPRASLPVGRHQLGLEKARDAELYIPESYRANGAAKLIVALHGAGGSGARIGARLQSLADGRNLVLLAPDSRGPTWDAVRGDFGVDVAFIDRALAETFRNCVIATDSVVLAGFSDGATYALSLGLANGDLFGRVIAYSPGFVIPAPRVGKPRLFVSHGTRDAILPIDRASRRIVPALRASGYEVDYREFDGEHEMPPDVKDASMEWLYNK